MNEKQARKLSADIAEVLAVTEIGWLTAQPTASNPERWGVQLHLTSRLDWEGLKTRIVSYCLDWDADEEEEESAPKRIIVNGRTFVTRDQCLGFSDIALYTNALYDTVTFRHGPENHTEGELVPNGPVVVIVDGMEFEAANTGSA